jgi:hypothetical protein
MNWNAGFLRMQLTGIAAVVGSVVVLFIFPWIELPHVFVYLVDLAKLLLVAGLIIFVIGWIGRGFTSPQNGGGA